MAAFLHGIGGRGRYMRARRYQLMADINVTPLVDVMLVLLIVFMVTAPLLTVGIPVDLPKTEADAISQPDEPLVVTIDKTGKIFLQETPIEVASLVPRLTAITENKTDTRIFVRGDQTIAYGRVMEVMGTLTAAGFTQVALITELPRAPTAGDEPAGEGGN